MLKNSDGQHPFDALSPDAHTTDTPSSPPSPPSSAARKPQRQALSRKTATKLFVLDTNVLMHDPTSLFRFEEHDLFIPIVTLEELDSHKTGMSEAARNARQTSRFLDELINRFEGEIDEGVPLQIGRAHV